MRRLSVRLAIIVLGIGLVLLSLALAERQLGKRRLSRTLAAIERTGDTLSVAVFRPPTVPDASNAWFLLLPHTNNLAKVPDIIREPLPLWRWASAGTLLPLGSGTNGADPEVAAKELADAMGALGNALAGGEELRQSIHQALARPDLDSGCSYQEGFFEMPQDTTVLLSAGRWLHAEACKGLIDRDAVATRRALVSLLRLLRHQRRQPLLIGQLTRYSVVIRTLGLTAHGLRDSRFLSTEDLIELREAWAGFGVLADFEQSLQMERAVAQQHFQLLATRPVRRAEAIGWADESRKMMDLDAEPTWQRAWRTLVQEPLWPWLWADHDLAWSLTHWNYRIEAARRAQSASWTEAAFDISALDLRSGFLDDDPLESVPGPSWADRMRCRFSLSGPSLFSDRHYFLSAYRAEVARRLTVAALHVHTFRRERGRWPASLAQAYSGAGGGEGPSDPMDGRPLRYRRQEDETGFLLYSVGSDGKDDGGSTELESQKLTYRTPFDGKDWVWPRLGD